MIDRFQLSDQVCEMRRIVDALDAECDEASDLAACRRSHSVVRSAHRLIGDMRRQLDLLSDVMDLPKPPAKVFPTVGGISPWSPYDSLEKT